VVIIWLRASGRSEWMVKAVEAAAERPATAEEIEEMRGEW
jgi:hypothetical protein